MGSPRERGLCLGKHRGNENKKTKLMHVDDSVSSHA